MHVADIVPVKSLGTTGTRYTNDSSSIGATPNGAGVRYTAGIVGWHIPALYEDHHSTARSNDDAVIPLRIAYFPEM